MKQKLQKIAQDILGIETLETRRADSLDFYDLAVWSIKKALAAAYETGFAAGKSDRNSLKSPRNPLDKKTD